MPDTLREKIGERIRLGREQYHTNDLMALDILALVEADARERERKAWLDCYWWTCREAIAGCLPSSNLAKAEAARRYP